MPSTSPTPIAESPKTRRVSVSDISTRLREMTDQFKDALDTPGSDAELLKLYQGMQTLEAQVLRPTGLARQFQRSIRASRQLGHTDTADALSEFSTTGFRRLYASKTGKSIEGLLDTMTVEGVVAFEGVPREAARKIVEARKGELSPGTAEDHEWQTKALFAREAKAKDDTSLYGKYASMFDEFKRGFEEDIGAAVAPPVESGAADREGSEVRSEISRLAAITAASGTRLAYKASGGSPPGTDAFEQAWGLSRNTIASVLKAGARFGASGVSGPPSPMSTARAAMNSAMDLLDRSATASRTNPFFGKAWDFVNSTEDPVNFEGLGVPGVVERLSRAAERIVTVANRIPPNTSESDRTAVLQYLAARSGVTVSDLVRTRTLADRASRVMANITDRALVASAADSDLAAAVSLAPAVTGISDGLSPERSLDQTRERLRAVKSALEEVRMSPSEFAMGVVLDSSAPLSDRIAGAAKIVKDLDGGKLPVSISEDAAARLRAVAEAAPFEGADARVPTVEEQLQKVAVQSKTLGQVPLAHELYRRKFERQRDKLVADLAVKFPTDSLLTLVSSVSLPLDKLSEELSTRTVTDGTVNVPLSKILGTPLGTQILARFAKTRHIMEKESPTPPVAERVSAYGVKTLTGKVRSAQRFGKNVSEWFLPAEQSRKFWDPAGVSMQLIDECFKQGILKVAPDGGIQVAPGANKRTVRNVRVDVAGEAVTIDTDEKLTQVLDSVGAVLGLDNNAVATYKRAGQLYRESKKLSTVLQAAMLSDEELARAYRDGAGKLNPEDHVRSMYLLGFTDEADSYAKYLESKDNRELQRLRVEADILKRMQDAAAAAKSSPPETTPPASAPDKKDDAELSPKQAP